MGKELFQCCTMLLPPSYLVSGLPATARMDCRKASLARLAKRLRVEGYKFSDFTGISWGKLDQSRKSLAIKLASLRTSKQASKQRVGAGETSPEWSFKARRWLFGSCFEQSKAQSLSSLTGSSISTE